MPKYGYLVVEGPHDLEFAYRLLSPFGFKRIQWEKDLDQFLDPLVPRKFPQDDGDLQKRIPVPLFLQSDSHAIAIHSAGGDSRLTEVVQENAVYLDHSQITGVGILLDSDNAIPVLDRFNSIKSAMQQLGISMPSQPGVVQPGVPRYGAYVLPDNTVQGTLEELLLETAAITYPKLLASATQHIDNAILGTDLIIDDKKGFNKPAGRKKAIIGAMASVLRPGKSVQVSIQDNRWFRENALHVPRVKAVQEFLKDLFDL